MTQPEPIFNSYPREIGTEGIRYSFAMLSARSWTIMLQIPNVKPGSRSSTHHTIVPVDFTDDQIRNELFEWVMYWEEVIKRERENLWT